MSPNQPESKLPPFEVRVRNTAYLLLVVSWAFMAVPALMIVFLLIGQPMVERGSGRPVTPWLEFPIALGMFAVGFALNRVARWMIKQYRARRTAFGMDL